LWLKQCWCIPPEANAEFVRRMEEVLDVDQRPSDPQRPSGRLDEARQPLLSEVREPLPRPPGEEAKRLADK
jgi:hypothetical protein